MPELPDLQVFSRNLDKQLSGKKLKEITVKNSKKLNATIQLLKDSLEKQKLKKIYRMGKELYFEFENQQVLGLHLMLNGELHLFKENPPGKFVIVELVFADGSGLSLTDFRGLAKVSLNPAKSDAPDALEVNETLLKKIVKDKKAIIKNILLDQQQIGGIGNAYADEILWEAGISPFSIAKMIPDEKLKDLAKAIKVVLTHAEKQILKTHPDIISGEIRDFLKIHTSKKTSSPSGVPIQIKKTGARKTYFTDEQELFK